MHNTIHMGGAPSVGGGPNQAMFLHNLPHNPPQIPFNCPPAIQQLMAPIAGYGLMALQQRSGENPIRAYYFNICSSNGWQNQHVQMLLSQIADLVEVKMAFQNLPWEHAVPQAADEMVSIMVGVVAASTPALHQYLVSPAQQQAAQQAGLKLQEIQNAVMQLRQLSNGMPLPNGGGVMVMGNSGNFNGNTYVNNQVRRGGTSFGPTGGHYNPSYGNPQPHVNVGTGGPFGTVNVGGAGGYGGNAGATIWAPSDQQIQHNQQNNPRSGYGSGHQDRSTIRPVESVTGEPSGRVETNLHTKPKFPPPPNLRNQQPRVEHEAGFVRPDPVQQPLPEDIFEGAEVVIQYNGHTFYNLDSDSDWPKTTNHERPWDHILLDDYSEVMPAALSPWKVETTLDNPYHPVYDPSTHVLMHVHRPDGTVVEYVTEWKPAMDYLRNELDPRLKRAAREVNDLTNNEIRDTAWVETKGLKPHPNLRNQLVPAAALPTVDTGEGEELKEALPIERSDVVLLAHGLNEAETKAAMAAHAANIDKSSVREYMFDEVDPNTAQSGDRGRVVTLSQFKDYPAFVNMYKSLKERMDPDLWAEIDQRVTQAIMVTLSKTLSLDGWGIESVFDIAELTELLEQNLGKNVVELFNSYAEFNLKTSLRVMDANQTTSYMREFLGVSEENSKNHVIFIRRINVLTLPWKFDELSLTFGDDNGGMIGETVMPDLYNTVKEMFERLEHSLPKIAQYLIRTRDGKTMQLLRGGFNTGTLLIFQVDVV